MILCIMGAKKWISILKVYKRSRTQPNVWSKQTSKQVMRHAVVFVIHPDHINCPSQLGLVADKFIDLQSTLIRKEIPFFYTFHPLFFDNKRESLGINVFRIENLPRALLNLGPLQTIEMLWRAMNPFLNSVKRLAVWDKYRSSVWSVFLREYVPRCVIGIGVDSALVESARGSGIPVFELMHGVFYDEKDMPGASFINGERKFLAINGFLSWDRLHYEKMISRGISTFLIGFPNSSSAIDQEVRDTDSNSNLNVLFTLSLNEPSASDPFGMFSQELMNQIISLPCTWTKSFRLHPTFHHTKLLSQEVTEWIEQKFPGALVHFPLNVGAFESLKGIDLHVTHHSSFFVEASIMGVPTLIMERGFEACVSVEFFEVGLVRVASQPLTISEIQEFLSSGTKRVDLSFNEAEFLRVICS